MRVSLQRPWMPPDAAISAYFDMSRSAGWFSNNGPCVRELTRRIETHVSAQAVLVANCTWGIVAALQAATVAFGTRRREYVICPSYSFVATASAIESAGFSPVFVDCDQYSWQPDVAAVLEAVELYGERVAAVLGTSTSGTPAGERLISGWKNAAAKVGAPLVIDSAAAFGAHDNHGVPVGARGDVEIFSFHATKPFAIGEGGVITTTNSTIADLAARMINFGFDVERNVISEGTNSKMSEVAAAIGLAVWDVFPQLLSTRQARANMMRTALETEGFTFQENSHLSTWQMLSVQTPSTLERDRIEQRCTSGGIETRRYYGFGIHETAHYSKFPVVGDMSGTAKLTGRALALPMSVTMSGPEIVDVLQAATGRPVGSDVRDKIEQCLTTTPEERTEI